MPNMPSYQDFAKRARERFQQSQNEKRKKPTGQYEVTRHAEYKMKQYGLSLQKVKGVIRNPKRVERGVAMRTIAVMQPVSPKKEGEKETWKQELWVMYQKKEKKTGSPFEKEQLRIISAWRYPGVSPLRNPIPSEILLELEEELA